MSMNLIKSPYPVGVGSGAPPITSGLILNWDAREVTVADGAQVGTGDWFDLSPAANHPVNNSGSGKPVFRATGGAGGGPAVQYDAIGGTGSQSFFALTNTVAPTSCTIFALLKHANSNPLTVIAGQTGALQFRIYQDKINFVRATQADMGSSTSTLSTSAFNLCVGTYNLSTGAFAFRLNGSANGSGTHGTPVSGNWKAVARNEADVITGEFFVGYHSHILIYDTVLSGGDITTTEAWIQSEWGI